MTRCAIYSRVSREEQSRGLSLSTQAADARAWAEGMGWDVVAEYVDAGASGASVDRPGLGELLASAAAGELDAVVVWKQDRLARTNQALSELLGRLLAAGVRVWAHTESRDPLHPEDLMTAIRGALASQERQNIRERSMRGRDEAARLGRWSGGEPPFGTRAVPAPGGRGSVLVPEPAEAEAIRRVWSWVVEDGLSVYESARRLNGEGVTTRRGLRWSRGNLRALLRSPRLSGRSTRSGHPVEVPTPLSPAEFAALQEALDRGSGRYAPGGEPSEYPLSGRLFDPEGHHWVGGRRKGVRWMHCHLHPSYAPENGPGPCGWDERRWVKADRVEAAVAEALRRDWLADGGLHLRVAALDHLARLHGDGGDDGTGPLRARVRDLEARYRRLLVDMAGEDLDRSLLREATAEVAADLRAAREALARAEAAAPSPVGAEWARLRGAMAEGVSTMADLADVSLGPLGERAEAMAMLDEVAALADRARERLEAGDLGAVARSLDLRVTWEGRDSIRVEGTGTVYLEEDWQAPGSR